MRLISAELAGVHLLEPVRRGDARGWFAEVYKRGLLGAAGLNEDWPQENQSLSRAAGTVRGLHFQKPPFAQAKLVRVLAGAVLDVVVDLRRGSPSFRRVQAFELSAENGLQLYVPEGFAHGFCTLAPDTQVAYKVSAPYVAESEAGLAWDDPELGVAWPVTAATAVLSPRDRAWPALAELLTPFP